MCEFVLVYFGIAGSYSETLVERVKKGKRIEVCSLPLRSSAGGAIERAALDRSAHDRA